MDAGGVLEVESIELPAGLNVGPREREESRITYLF